MGLENGPDIDFDDLYVAWQRIAILEHNLSELESALDRYRALFKQQCLVEKNFWPNNRPPSMEYLKQVVHYRGNTDEQATAIENSEKAIAKTRSDLTEAKGALDVMHWTLRVWQTKSANARKVLVE